MAAAAAAATQKEAEQQQQQQQQQPPPLPPKVAAADTRGRGRGGRAKEAAPATAVGGAARPGGNDVRQQGPRQSPADRQDSVKERFARIEAFRQAELESRLAAKEQAREAARARTQGGRRGGSPSSAGSKAAASPATAVAVRWSASGARVRTHTPCSEPATKVPQPFGATAARQRVAARVRERERNGAGRPASPPVASARTEELHQMHAAMQQRLAAARRAAEEREVEKLRRSNFMSADKRTPTNSARLQLLTESHAEKMQRRHEEKLLADKRRRCVLWARLPACLPACLPPRPAVCLLARSLSPVPACAPLPVCYLKGGGDGRVHLPT